MATFTGRAPASTYKNLLNIDNSNAGIDGTLRVIQDGEGTTCQVSLSTTGLQIGASGKLSFASGGEIDFTGATVTALTTNVVDDTTPQSGGDWDANGFDFLFDDGTGIRDDSDNETLIFGKTASAVNYAKLSNAAAGGAVYLQALGGDTNIDFEFEGKGTGYVVLIDGALADDVDKTKRAVFDLTNITSANDRVITVPDANVDLGDVNTAYQQGKETIWIPAAAMTPTVSNGCAVLASTETTAGRPDMITLDFDKDADEGAQFQVSLPKRYDGGTVTYQLFWTQSVGAVSTGVAFGLQGVATADNETIDVAYGTAVVVTDDAQGAVEETYISAESSAITIAGTPTGGKLCFFRLYRDVSDVNDDLAGDARVIGIKLHFSTNANDDT